MNTKTKIPKNTPPFLALPTVEKTLDMRQVEKEHGGKDLRLILKDKIETTGSQKAAAKKLGRTESTISYWLLRLRMRVEMKPVVIIEGLNT
jgi:hypothetical protein